MKGLRVSLLGILGILPAPDLFESQEKPVGDEKAATDRNPKGPETGKFRVIRGGGWHSGANCNRVSHRTALPPQWVDFNVGFRIARDPER